MPTHAILDALLAEQRCHTAVSLHRVVQVQALALGRRISLRKVRTELKQLLAVGDVIQVSPHYYCARAVVSAAREWHAAQVCQELWTHGACTLITLIQRLGVDARFLRWVLDAAVGRILQGKHHDKLYLQLAPTVHQPVLSCPEVLETVRDQLRSEATIGVRTLGLSRLMKGLRPLLSLSQDAVLHYVRQLEAAGEVSVRPYNEHMLLIESLPALLSPAAPVVLPVALPAVVGLPVVTPLPARPAPTRHRQVLLTAALGRPERQVQDVSAPVITPLFPSADQTAESLPQGHGRVSLSLAPMQGAPNRVEVMASDHLGLTLCWQRPQARGGPEDAPHHPDLLHDAA